LPGTRDSLLGPSPPPCRSLRRAKNFRFIQRRQHCELLRQQINYIARGSMDSSASRLCTTGIIHVISHVFTRPPGRTGSPP
uniref:Uncharacterized protein n=1 Tax=Triticum urartu TaxID=4572 RepID=A0A8R7U673_TRIUA